MYARHILGKKGEDVAVEYLETQGYNILDRNFLCRQGEIDVVALDKNYVVFVEIKARTNTEYGLPSESVTKRKLEHLIKAAKYYLHVRNLEDANVRIDAIEIYVANNKYYINHLKQILWFDIWL